MTIRLLIAAIVITLSVKGQTSVYHPFPDSNAAWCCQSDGHTSPDCYRDWTTYQLNGQAQISTNTYNRLEVYSFSIHYLEDIHFFCVEHDTTISVSTLYIRQDTSLKTIWVYDSTTFTDRVLYDFNLSLGDTLDTSKAYFADGFGGVKVITSIDSIFINGNYRKRYNYNTGCQLIPTDTSMIEGIGALHGLLYPASCFEFSFHLNAMTEDNIVLIGDTTGACQDFTSGVNELKLQGRTSIFPNPFHISATLEVNSEFINSQLNIYNTFGERVHQQRIFSLFTTLNLNELSDGIYFYQVVNSKANLKSGKFQIE